MNSDGIIPYVLVYSTMISFSVGKKQATERGSTRNLGAALANFETITCQLRDRRAFQYKSPATTKYTFKCGLKLLVYLQKDQMKWKNTFKNTRVDYKQAFLDGNGEIVQQSISRLRTYIRYFMDLEEKHLYILHSISP